MKSISILSLTFFIISCCLTPTAREGMQYIPEVRTYVLETTDLTESEKMLVITSEPIIGHANHVVFYYKWKERSGKTVLTVETSAPGQDFTIIKLKKGNKEVK